jgi:hypothetical protein
MSRPELPDGWEDLIAVASRPDHYRWLAQIRATGGCAEPIHLIGRSSLVKVGTGAVLHTYDTDNEPDGRLLVACRNRRASRCPSCAEVYRADTYHLINTGLAGGKGVPDTIAGHPRVFVTLTAPSFGPVHHRVIGADGKVRRCHPRGRIQCRRRHRADDACLGQPLHPDSYHYPAVVIWNAMAPALWARTTTAIRRQLAAIAGLPQAQFNKQARVSFAKVAEYQARGVVHFHAIVRLDGPDGPDSPQHLLDAKDVSRAIQTAVRNVVIASPNSEATGGPLEIRWGDQLDISPITAGADRQDGKLTDGQVAGYIAKYATKGAEATGTVDTALCCRDCKGTGIAHPASPSDCPTCAGTGSTRDLDTLPTSEHTRTIIRTCWELGTDPALTGLRLRAWAHMLGFKGHFSTKSRLYSTTLTALRNVRQAYQTARTLAALKLSHETVVVRGLEHVHEGLDDATVLIIGHWRYAGRGLTHGQAAFAKTVAQDLTDNRGLARQALLDESGWEEPWDESGYE